MIRYLKHSEINPEKWNQAVRNSLFSPIFVEYEILDFLTGADTWDALVQDNYDAVMPLPYRKKGVLKYVYTPFFIPQMGIFSKHKLCSENIEAFLSIVSKHFILADLLLNEKNIPEKELESECSNTLSLQLPYNELYANFSQNTKRNLKAGEKHQCSVTIQQEAIADIIALFKNNKGHEEVVHFQDHDYENLQKLSEYLLNKGLLEVYGVRTNDNRLAAGALFVKDGNRRWFWFSGRDNALSEGKPMFTLLNAFIRDHAETDLILDFNGSSNPNIARLYQSFGSVPHTIPFVRRYKNPFWHTLLKMLGK